MPEFTARHMKSGADGAAQRKWSANERDIKRPPHWNRTVSQVAVGLATPAERCLEPAIALVARPAIQGFERVRGAPDEEGDSGEGHWEVLLRGVDERLAISRRQWPAVKAATKPNG